MGSSSFLADGPLADPTGYRAMTLLTKYAAPAAVLQAKPDDVFDVLPLVCNFADAKFQYPVHTKAAAWVSAAAYHDSGSTDEPTATRIKSACDYHRLWDEWDRLQAAAGQVHKLAAEAAPAPRDRWALPDAKKYPLNTADQVKTAAAFFKQNAEWLPRDARRTFAKNAADAAEDFTDCITFDDKARLEAEAGLSRAAADPSRAFADRTRVAPDPTMEELLNKAAAYAAYDPVGAADVLRQIDRQMGWQFPDPLTQLVGETRSQARTKLATVVKAASGAWWAVTDLDRVPDATVYDLFGGAPVLTRDAKAGLLKAAATGPAFEQLLAGHGAAPVARPGRPAVDWAALAAD